MQQKKQEKVAEASGSRTRIGADSTQDQRDASTPSAPNAPNVPPVVHGVPELQAVIDALGNEIGTLLARLAPEAHPLPKGASVAEILTHVVQRVRATDNTAALTAERDYFRAAYERKLNEHSATLDDAQQLCAERDALREALEKITAEARHHLHTGASSLDRRIAQAESVLATTPEQSLAALEDAACLRMAREFCEGKRNGRGANSLLSGYVNAMRAEVAAEAAAEAQWQPIETAPKDGTSVLCFVRTGIAVMRWSPDGSDNVGGRPCWITGQFNYCDDYLDYYPTHWMPLPAPPTERP